MSLIPTAAATFGNLRYDAHIAEVRVTLALLPGINSARITLPVGVELSAAPGDDGLLDLDGGEGSETVLTGKIARLRRGLLKTEITLGDAGADLSRLRPAVTYEQQSAKDITNALAADAGAQVGSVEVDLPLAAYVAHQGRTAAEHIAYLAGLGGSIAYIDGEGALQVVARPEDSADMALLYGREIIDYQIHEQPVPAASRVMAGNGPAGSADAPDALRPTTEVLPGDAPKPGPTAVWSAAPVLRTPDAALAATEAATTATAAAIKRIQARCFLLPALRPGTAVEVQSLPDELSGGPWLVTRVVHRLKPDSGGLTSFEGVSAGSGSLGSLLGAVLSAVGSLL